MKNLHLMPMNSTFDDDTVIELTDLFPEVENLFLHPVQRSALAGYPNSRVVPEAFTPEYINLHCGEYDQIFLHSLFLTPDQILRLSQEAVRKITWCIWGHDLYTTKSHKKRDLRTCAGAAIHCMKKLLRGTYIRQARHRRLVAERVAAFRRIAIGYPYDERMIRKKYGPNATVVYGPYFSRTTEANIGRLRRMHLDRKESTVHILIGHSGFAFLEHEKYLKRLAAYRDEDIRIHLVLSYGASAQRIAELTALAHSLFGPEKCEIITEMMPKSAYYEYLTQMDIAIFPFRHQSALGNTRRLAYMGVKMYLDPRGVLAKGFRDGGVRTFDCRRIGRIPFAQFCAEVAPPDTHALLFDTFSYQKNIAAWSSIINDRNEECHE